MFGRSAPIADDARKADRTKTIAKASRGIETLREGVGDYFFLTSSRNGQSG